MKLVNDFTGITSGDFWTDGFGNLRQVITFGFAETLPDYQATSPFLPDPPAFFNSFRELTNAEKALARDGFNRWEDASALAFIEVDADDADIVLGVYDFSTSPIRSTSDGFAFFPGQSKISGDIFIDSEQSLAPDLYTHEIGHALGLEHPFEGERVLPPELQTREITVMISGALNSPTGELGAFDKPAIQSLYGGVGQTPAKIVPKVGYSDALISSTSFSNLSQIGIGETRTINIQVSNFGEERFGAATTAIAILSTDGIASVDDIKLAEAAVGDLAPNAATGTLALTFTMPDCVAPGSYQILLMVDPEDLVAERDELNNVDVLTATTITGTQNPNADPADCPPPFLVAPGSIAVTPQPDAEVMALMGTEGADELTGDGDGNALSGLGGADTIIGLGGSDTLDGGGGRDSIDGNGGRDIISGGGGRDVINGGGGRDTLDGGGGRDSINGGGGRDQLDGGGGRDTLDGGGGRDAVAGGGGGDLILGGRGSDELTGNGGRDVFQFSRGNGRDTITDFRQGVDRIGIEEGADSFSDLNIIQQGDNVLISFANTRVIVETDDANAFTAADFIF